MSIIHDVVNCVKEIDRIGVKKKEMRRKGEKRIHSYKTKNEVLKISKQFARFVKNQYGINKLHEVRQEHYIAFLNSKSETTLDYRRTIETHLRLLQEGQNLRAARFGKEEMQFITEKRMIPTRSRTEAVRDRSYSEKEIKDIQSVLSPSVARSVALMLNLGLRVGESVELRRGHVQGDFVIIKNETITKGGRDREIPIPVEFRAELNQMLEGLGLTDKIAPVAAGTVQNAVKKACDELGIKSRGAHGFRHTYARNRIDEMMTAPERDLFSKCLDRYAENKPFNYAVRDRELYRSMKTKMDQVHKNLGHGENRFDLALRYMK